MPTKQPMRCPSCNVDLNYHADKLVSPVSAEEVAQADPVFGGVIKELHCCPQCGKTETRQEA